MATTMNVVVAANIKAARKELGWTQQELADRMSLAGAAWTRAISGYAEAGERRISVDEIAALSVVFDTVPSYWLAPSPDHFTEGDPTVIAGDKKIPGEWLVAAAAAGDAAPPLGKGGGPSSWGRFYAVLGRVVAQEGFQGRRARLLHRTLARVRAIGVPEDE